jgi:ferredoxin-type protein NapH
MLEIIAEALQLTIAVSLILGGILAILIWTRNLTRRVTILRIFIQVVSLVIIFLTLPILAEWPSLVLGAIILVTIVFGRFFCGWICPFGLYMDLITIVRTSLKIRYWKLSDRLNNALHILRYAIVGGVLALPFFYDPLSTQVWRSFLLFQDQFKPLIVFFLGPLEPLLIPWSGAVGFNGYSLSYPYIREIIAFSSGPLFVTLNVFLFIAFTVVGSFMVRRFWCRFCPTGVSIAILNRLKAFKWAPILKLTKVEEKCTKCGICKRVCPVQVTEVYEDKGGNVTSSKCVECFRCVEMCPYEGCLKVEFAGKTLYKSKNWLKEEE